MKLNFRYQDFVAEQRAGSVHGVFIDETGSPGLRDTPSHLHPDRKSWVAVIVPKSQIADVWRQFPRALSELQAQVGATEFHFADVLAGRREFKDVDLTKRLGLFKFMAHIFEVYNFPVFVQTLDPATLNDIRRRAKWPDRLGPFDFRKHEDLSLFFLILRVKQYLESTYASVERHSRVFIDEGFQKNGAAIAVPWFGEVFADGLLCFGSSESILPLQLADFAAFCLNRTQLLLGRKSLNKTDKELLDIIQPLAWNYQNIPRISLEFWLSGL